MNEMERSSFASKGIQNFVAFPTLLVLQVLILIVQIMNLNHNYINLVFNRIGTIVSLEILELPLTFGN